MADNLDELEIVMGAAARGDLNAQRKMADFFCYQAQQPEGGFVHWLSAEHYARQCSVRGYPNDLKRLAAIMMAQAAMYPTGSLQRIRHQAEAVHIADMLAEFGDEQVAANIGDIVANVSPEAVAQASRWSKGRIALISSASDAPAPERTHDVPRVAMLIARNADPAFCFDFDPARWLGDEANIALVAGDDLALFAAMAPGVFECHWLFASRGRDALGAGLAAFRAMFEIHGAEVLRGITPTACPRAAWFNRQLGAKSLGIIETVHGTGELFVVTPDMIEGK